MPRGIYTRQREAAKQGGIVSGMVRRERILDAYMKIVQEYGVYEALRICRARSWKQGYDSRRKHEIRHGHRETKSHNPPS